MKKLLKLLLVVTSMVQPIIIVSCDKKQTNTLIDRPEPILPISKQGFENVNIDAIEIDKIMYNYDLYEQVIEQLKKANYNVNDINVSVIKNGINTLDKDNSDLFRNGTYEWTFSNKNNDKEYIKAKLIITNSLNLADIFSALNIGTIYDSRPKSILIGLLTKNLNLINMIEQISEQLIDVKNYIYNQNNKSAIIKISEDNDFPKLSGGKDVIPKKFYGSIEVNFEIQKFDYAKLNDDQKGITFNQFWKNLNYISSSDINMPNNIGIINQFNIYSLLMSLIITNFTTGESQFYWPIIINDILSEEQNSFKPEKSDKPNAIEGKDFMVNIYFKEYKNEYPNDASNEQLDKNSFIFDQKEPVKLYFKYLN
ncbi:hypothetical protein [Spiroplasma tabanidicola]|uniref:Lipoprotein n=1 Tax=Spiroplasma tabanidicola TaxID=324079 RepID=A0A6I6CBU1_9MOLU|nr:hypothetical protein [Spiroplasma tabanidicola]QGS51562.1 hypothetical protein STABA_v1c01950 [Spiroplasma tabanidicola]